MDVLLVIDMQEGSFRNADKFDAEGVVDRINRLSDQVRRNDGRVVFVQHDGTVEDDLVPHSPGWMILASLNRHESDLVVRKTINDAFFATNLNRLLLDLNAETLFVSGWATDLCVDTTIRAAVSLGHRIVAVADCHTVADRPHLKASEVIRHHNWVWQNLLTTGDPVQVLSLAELSDLKSR